MKLVFMGTPDFAVPVLEKLIEAGHDVRLVVTMSDKPKGRSGKAVPSPVKEAALKHGIEVYQPSNLRDKRVYNKLAKAGAEALIVAAYGAIVPKNILDLPKYGCINVHASLLPAYRGAAPIQWALMDGRKVTGTTIMRMNEGLDTGDILACEELTISDDDTAGSLFEKLSLQGAGLLVKTLADIDSIKAVAQPEESYTEYARMVKKEDGKIKWFKHAEIIDRQIRAMNPWPGAYTEIGGKTLKIWKAEICEAEAYISSGTILSADGELVIKTGCDAIRVLEVQVPGKRRMKTEEFLRGYKINAGERAGDYEP